MLAYVGNGPYCYANSAAMLLESGGEAVDPRLIEALTGVGLGAFWLTKSQTFFLSGRTSDPDVGVSPAFALLGFEVVEEVEADGSAMPIAALELQPLQGAVMLGPLDLANSRTIQPRVERTGSIALSSPLR